MNHGRSVLRENPSPADSVPALDVSRVRRDFPILARQFHGQPLAFLDNANSTQKPSSVIETVERFYRSEYANIHRGLYELSENATRAYNRARSKVQRLLNAAESREIIFVRGTTEAINLVAGTFGRKNVNPDDEILITGMEHHSNIVPWQLLCEERGARLVVTPIDDHGDIDLEDFESRIGPRTRLISVVHISNALGTVNRVREMVEIAHRHGVPILVDGAQAVAHRPVDVRDLGCDFYVFSGHKVYGPTGIGVLYGKAEHLEAMPPYHGGGDMIRQVTFEKTTYAEIPDKFEAGTPNVAGVIGLGAAIDYLQGVGLEAAQAHEAELLGHAQARLETVEGLRIIGTARERSGLITFLLREAHPHDVGTILDREGIAVRAGHHCAMPVMDRFGVPATVRASFGIYNTRDEIDRLVEALQKVREMFA